MMYKSYAGIGSRDITNRIRQEMEGMGFLLASMGYTLRSGGADGSDTAFEKGCDRVNGQKEIYLPWQKFNNNTSWSYPEMMEYWDKAAKVAEKFHPKWSTLSKTNRAFHTRNCFQVLGSKLDSPVEFIVCYTCDGKASGGTGQAMRIAKHLKIPIYNLYEND